MSIFRPHRVLVALLLGCAALSAARAAPDAAAMKERVRACTACHDARGHDGPDAFYPRIAGKPQGYLYNQLRNFRDGRRHYPLMVGLLANLSDAYLYDIAHYFSTLQAAYAPPEARTAALSSAAAAQARRLIRDGDATRELPACVECHGPALMGVAPAIPGLLGLPKAYLRAQLGAWKSGTRHAAAPDCMADIAAKLSPDEISRISAWLAAQSLPANAAPAPSAAKLPHECGSTRTGDEQVQR